MIYLDKKIDIEICLIYILNIAYKYILQEKKEKEKRKKTTYIKIYRLVLNFVKVLFFKKL